MYFIVNEDYKIILGWSAKCGCSHIKNMYHFIQDGNINQTIHKKEYYASLSKEVLDNINDYKIFLFIRNPYKRIVSGFLHKCNYENGESYSLWNKDIKLTFSHFIDVLITNEWKYIDRHHFTPQLTEDFNDTIRNSKNLTIYDIEKIDYKHIGEVFNKEIPNHIIHNKINENQNKQKEKNDFPVYDLELREYNNKNMYLKNFYNDSIQQKIYDFYKIDFDFFKEKGFDYQLEN